MKFLIDVNLSPRLALQLNESGHDAVHGVDLGLEVATDETVLERARTEGRIVVSADSDFGTIFARTRSTSPSVLFFRRGVGRRVEEIAALITENLELMEEPLREGSVVVLGEGSVRIRQLPIL